MGWIFEGLNCRKFDEIWLNILFQKKVDLKMEGKNWPLS